MRWTGRRRSLRRSVALECFVHSTYWDGPLAFVASDLSNDGIWLDSQVALEPGDEVRLSFVPPGLDAVAVTAVATVVRVGTGGHKPCGMGLAFTFLSEVDRTVLVHSLAGLPPHLPGSRVPPALPSRRAPLLASQQSQ